MKSQLYFNQMQHALLSFPEVLLYECPLVGSLCPLQIAHNGFVHTNDTSSTIHVDIKGNIPVCACN